LFTVLEAPKKGAGGRIAAEKRAIPAGAKDAILGSSLRHR
jgi:hypothetical protein